MVINPQEELDVFRRDLIRVDKEWQEIDGEGLKQLYYDQQLTDRQIATLFGVTKSQVSYKRAKFGITFLAKTCNTFKVEHGDLYNDINKKTKAYLMNPDNIDAVSKAITHFVFRNGPVEDMHAHNKLSDKDMKILNKYMVNRIAGLLTAIAQDKWLPLGCLLSGYTLWGSGWDKAEPDMEEIDQALSMATDDKFKTLFHEK